MKLKSFLKLALLISIEIVFCFTPLGTIPIGPIAATLSMIPVIVASLLFGKAVGAVLGFVFATCSFIFWTFIQPGYPTAFLFTPFSESAGYRGGFFSIVICFLPRILAGIVPALITNNKNSVAKDALSSVLGSLTNTILVLLLILIFYKNQYQTILGQNILYVMGLTVLTNGIPECVICGFVCPIIKRAIKLIGE